MNKYKPEYLGKCLTVDDPSNMTNFLSNDYDAFSKIYDTCKDHSENINNFEVMNDNDDKLSIKISTSLDTMSAIKQEVIDESISIENDIITVKK